jgi:DNA-directed RNA polymerase subunit RPC12/RpoP
LGTIHDFKPKAPPRQVYVCGICGNDVFILTAEGRVQCDHCDRVAENLKILMTEDSAE